MDTIQTVEVRDLEKSQRKEQEAVAKKLFLLGFDLEAISETIGLSKEELEALLEEKP